MLDGMSAVEDVGETVIITLSFLVLVVRPTDDSCPVWLEDQSSRFWIVVCAKLDVDCKSREASKKVDGEEDEEEEEEVELKMADKSKVTLLLAELVLLLMLAVNALLVCSRLLSEVVSEDIPNMLGVVGIAVSIVQLIAFALTYR